MEANVAMNRELGVNISTITPAEAKELLPELVMEGQAADHDIGRFRLSRFEEGDLLLPEHPYADRAHN